MAQSAYDDNDAAVGSRYIHDPNEYKVKKFEKSDPYYRNTRISSCSHIVKKKDGIGKACAIAYPLEKTGWKNPASYQNTIKSSENKSMASEAYQKRVTEHCGVVKKKLCRYDPNAVRSRLPKSTIVMPYKNSSQVVIGDRANHYTRRWVTINKNMQTAYSF